MPKCDLRVALQLFEIALQHGCSLVNLLHIFRTLFPKNTAGWLLLKCHGRKKIKVIKALFL